MQGRIITFYSYKGGTGRSMALANVAWILASRGKRVLIIDWDLEAPGVHRYFRPFLLDPDMSTSPGLIEFVSEYVKSAKTPDSSSKSDWYVPFANISPYAVSLRWTFPTEGTIDLVPAGRQGPAYSPNVNSFDWEHFYRDLGGRTFFEKTKEDMRLKYDYVLIDSRTGVSDTSGICTIQMPDILVICFTLNNQSIDGAATVAESVYSKQYEHEKPHGFSIIPVPMRVRQAEIDKLERREQYAKERFASFVNDKLWARISVPDVAYYSYEEVLATFRDNPAKFDTVLASLERLSAEISDYSVSTLNPPNDDERRSVLDAFAQLPEAVQDEPVLDAWYSLRLLRWLSGLVFVAILIGLLAYIVNRYSLSLGERARTSAILGLAQSWEETDPLLSALLLTELQGSAEPPGGLAVAKTVASLSFPTIYQQVRGGSINSIEFSHDGQFIATAHDDGTARLWNTHNGRLVMTFKGHEGRVYSATFNTDDKKLLTASEDGSVRIWNIHDGEELSGMLATENLLSTSSKCHSLWINSSRSINDIDQSPHYAKFSPDQKAILVSYANHDLAVYQYPANEMGICIYWYGSTLRTSGPFFSPDGEWLAVADKWGINLIHIQDWRQIAVPITLPTNWTLLGMTADNRVLLSSGGSSPQFLIWDSISQRRSQYIPLDAPPLQALSSLDGDDFAIAVQTGVVLGSFKGGGLQRLKGISGNVSAMAFTAQSNYLGMITDQGMFIVWPTNYSLVSSNTDWNRTLESIRHSTTACLNVTQRRNYLGESDAVALEAYLRCEASQGRQN